MALHFILGGSGSGKSTRLYQEIIDRSIRDPQRQHLVIVPEQSTLQTTRQIVMQHPAKGILNIDVLSFNRLSYRVFEQTSARVDKVLSETGKNLVLRRVASGIRETLPWLGARLDRQGYISEVKSMLSELAQYEITPDMLRGLAGEEKETSLLKRKLMDIATLQEAFAEAKKGLYMTAEEVPALLAAHAKESALLKGSVLAFDGFTGFTPVQMTAIASLMGIARDIFVSVCIDPRENIYGHVPEHELFALSKRTIQALTKMAKETGVPIADPVWLDGEGKRFAAGSELLRLEQGLMRRYAPAVKDNHTEYEKPNGVHQVFLNRLPNPEREAAFAAATVLSLLHEEQYDLKQIGIICSDLSTYAGHISRAFDRAHIPHFIDRKEPVLMNPCLEFIRASLEMADKRYFASGVMRWLRTGFAGISREDTDLLETYLLAAGIRSYSQWKKPWTRSVRSLSDPELEKVNLIREQLVEGLGAFMSGFAPQTETVRTYSNVLRALLDAHDLRGKLSEQAQATSLLPLSSAQKKQAEYAHVYDCVINILEEAETLLGGEIVSRKEFGKILEAGFDQAGIGALPAVPNQVYVGDLMRTRLGDVKALIFMGMNEGLLPYGSAGGGLLTPMERETLGNFGLRLSPSMKEDAYIRRFYLYLCFTGPSSRLYLTWSASDDKGAPLPASPLIREVQRILPRVLDVSQKTGDDLLVMEDVAAKAAVLRSADRRGGSEADRTLLNDLLEVLEQTGDHRSVEMANEGERFQCSSESITPEDASLLYLPSHSGSVSEMESFSGCPYAHFLQYGLSLKERETYTVRAVDTGTLFHDALERFGNEINTKDVFAWRTMTDETAFALADRFVEEAAMERFGGLFFDTQRNRFTVSRVQKTLHLTVWGMLRQIRQGAFTPQYLEVPFVEGGMTGRIDRIDISRRDGRAYAVIHDYKSGRARFDMGLLYDGRGMQLPIYLGQAMRFLQKTLPGDEIIPAGIFYDHLSEPLIKRDEPVTATDPTLDDDLLTALRPEGLISLEPDALRVFSEDAALRKLIAPVPVYKKDGSLSAKSPPAATKNQLIGTASYAAKKLQEQARQIKNGVIAAMPYRNGRDMACTYCPYKGVCAFDLRMKGALCRHATKLSREEIFRIMEEIGQQG